MALLTAKGIEKRFGRKQALRGVDMTLEAGKITGLLGPNGSGKTTLLKVIAGLLTPEGGEILYPGGVTGIAARNTVSLLPDATVLPGWMKVRDAFRYYEDMYRDYSPEKAAAMAELLGLSMEATIKKLSKGMQERVFLGLTFSRETSLYLLDEPLGGIDPMGKSKVLDSILSMQLEEASILLSTHLVKDVETIFDSVYFLSQGNIVYSGDCESIRQESGKTVEQAYLEVFADDKTA